MPEGSLAPGEVVAFSGVGYESGALTGPDRDFRADGLRVFRAGGHEAG